METVKRNFDKREVDLINTAGVDVTVEPSGHAAEYTKVGNRHKITADPDYVNDEETMVHETIHLMQEIDDTRPDDPNTRLADKKAGRMDRDARSKKEIKTEAEMMARVDNPNSNNIAFYDSFESSDKKASALKEDDIIVIKKAMKGKKKGEAPKVISKIWCDLKLAKYEDDEDEKKK